VTLEQKIIEAKRSYVYINKNDPDCVIIDEDLEDRLDPKIFDQNLLTIAGMHVIFAYDIPHRAIRCGRMR
jgi:hypothetical protein